MYEVVMTRDPATAEHKADTGPLTLPDEQPIRRPFPWLWAGFAVAITLIVGAAVLFLTRTADPMSDTRPIDVVKGFVAAVEAKDASKMLSYAAPIDATKELGPEVRAYMEYVESISFSDSAYTLLDNDGERAHVHWTATMHYKINLGSEVKSGDKPVDTVFELTKFEGAWYLKSAKPPET
jgi:hypothetical protein